MSSVNDLLDKVREAGNFPSDNALAQRLGLTRAVVSTWRSGRNPIPDERIAQLCALGKLDGPLWIALIHAERAQSATERALWRLMLDRMSAAAAVVALVALSMPGLANAKTAQIQAVSAADNGGMYIMLQRDLPIRTPTSPVLAACCSPSSNPPNARRTRLHGAQPSHPACRPAGVGSMHHLRTGLAMRLADFIERNAREILEDAVAFAETQAPDTVEFSAKQLRNHLPQILQAVVDDLRSPQTASQQLAKSHGLAPLKPGPESAASYHGRTRAIAGFGLNQMVAEYRALRASVLRRWASDQQLIASSIDDILRFNEAIDQAVAESLAQFSAEVESWRQIFLAALGHDLRGPLAAVMFSADTLASGLQDPALSRQAERIINGSMRMNKLLDDLLAYSRSKLGDGMAIHPVDCDLAQSLGEEVELLRAALPHVPIKYEAEGDARGCFDASSLREAVHNLTTNAAKYGEHGTDVRISLEGLVDQIMITVSNTGAELSDEAFNSLFDPLRRGSHNASQGEHASLGLGLFLVREICHAHRGTVHGRWRNGRTSFVITLPKNAD
ncbi:DUF3693 domain-containing protein [Stenotrophomonas maltophilia]